MEEVIVLLNFNKYLGGGETLMVRFSEYLQRKDINFLAFCSSNSYLNEALKKKNINKIRSISRDINFYYLNLEDRDKLIEELKVNIENYKNIRFVTFCMRDLYTVYSMSKDLKNCSITHLILHAQDDLYVGQTLFDKIIYKLFLIRSFSSFSKINFNRTLLKLLNSSDSLISMADVISKLWNKNYGIKIPNSHVVPLPSFVDVNSSENIELNLKKIIWIGRIVDFKIPAIIAMIHFINKNKEYSLTIVGEGNKNKILNYMNKNSLDSKRIYFIGEVEYNQLGEIIKKHSIGYAMGTSLIELSKYKIPVIIALANYNHQFFKKQICGGLFYNKDKGCDGSDLVFTKPENMMETIQEAIIEIQNNYHKIAQACYDFAKDNYSEEKNFGLYHDIIIKSKFLRNKDKEYIVPKSSFIRKFLFKKINN